MIRLLFLFLAVLFLGCTSTLSLTKKFSLQTVLGKTLVILFFGASNNDQSTYEFQRVLKP